jgi:hypothetical protein
MKKITASILFLVIVLAAGAQTKVTKTNIVGKWAMYSIEMPGQMHYNIDKDSLVLGTALKASVDNSQLAALTAQIKQQFAMFSKVGFQFKADGGIEMTAPTGEIEKERTRLTKKMQPSPAAPSLPKAIKPTAFFQKQNSLTLTGSSFLLHKARGLRFIWF